MKGLLFDALRYQETLHPIRPAIFQTVSLGTWVNKGERMRCWDKTGRDEGSVPIMGTTQSVGKREVEGE